MSKSNSFETALLEHVFINSNIANIGDATGLRGSTVAGNLYIALHTADPGEAGNQSTSEATYTGYARVAVARDAAEWTIAGNAVTNDNPITFGVCTAGTNTITYFSVGVASSGATEILYSGALTASLNVSAGITPEFAVGALDITED